MATSCQDELCADHGQRSYAEITCNGDQISSKYKSSSLTSVRFYPEVIGGNSVQSSFQDSFSCVTIAGQSAAGITPLQLSSGSGQGINPAKLVQCSAV